MRLYAEETHSPLETTMLVRYEISTLVIDGELVPFITETHIPLS